MRTYQGLRTDKGCVVTVRDNGGNGTKLPPRNDLINHSPDGFEWGYAGSGPAQLALAILADHLCDDRLADRWHQRFKAHFVQNFSGDSWRLSQRDIAEWCAEQPLESV